MPLLQRPRRAGRGAGHGLRTVRAHGGGLPASGEEVRLLEGVRNPGESYVFLPNPGVKNALLKLVREEAGPAGIPGTPNTVSAIVGPDGVRCYCAVEGEAMAQGVA